jgi:hypothetical protein
MEPAKIRRITIIAQVIAVLLAATLSARVGRITAIVPVIAKPVVILPVTRERTTGTVQQTATTITAEMDIVILTKIHTPALLTADRFVEMVLVSGLKTSIPAARIAGPYAVMEAASRLKIPSIVHRIVVHIVEMAVVMAPRITAVALMIARPAAIINVMRVKIVQTAHQIVHPAEIMSAIVEKPTVLVPVIVVQFVATTVVKAMRLPIIALLTAGHYVEMVLVITERIRLLVRLTVGRSAVMAAVSC